MARCGFAVPLILLLVSVASAQIPPQSDPRAVSLATQAMTALMNGVAVGDVTLSGNAVWTPTQTPSAGLPQRTERPMSRVGSIWLSAAGTEVSYATVPEALRKVLGSMPAEHRRRLPHTTAGRMPSIHAIT
jgi:hypothetical protein